MTYRGMDKAALDAAYNNSAAVGLARRDAIMADWTARTAALAARVQARRDLRYGAAERQRIDFFPCGTGGAPTLVFIHGGYWQFSDKETYGCVAAGPLAHGINVALVEYTLAPALRMDGIAAEIRAALAWLKANLRALGAAADGFVVAGHSAGGHLAALAMGEPGVLGALPISGIFDLEPIRLGALNDERRRAAGAAAPIGRLLQGVAGERHRRATSCGARPRPFHPPRRAGPPRRPPHRRRAGDIYDDAALSRRSTTSASSAKPPCPSGSATKGLTSIASTAASRSSAIRPSATSASATASRSQRGAPR